MGTALHKAASGGHLDVCRFLLAARADATAETSEGESPWKCAEHHVRGCSEKHMSCGAYSRPIQSLQYLPVCRLLLRSAGLPAACSPPAWQWRHDRCWVIFMFYLHTLWYT